MCFTLRDLQLDFSYSGFKNSGSKDSHKSGSKDFV